METFQSQDRTNGGSRERGETNDGILRIDFGEPEEGLEKISWEKFFEVFDGNGLDFLYQERTGDGGQSRFNKFVGKE